MPIGARYVTLHITIGEEKSKYASLAQENDFAPAYLLNLLRLVVKGTTKLREKSVINMICLLRPGVCWPNIMIGPSGLLLVVATYLQSQFQFYG
jgi:hypothetical protein